MAKKDDATFRTIPLNERVPELEEEVSRYMQTTPFDPVNDKLYTHLKNENFRDPVEQELWELEQIRRCCYGHDGMSPKMYFYFHFCKIQNISRGMIKPQYRVADQMWYRLIEECQASKEWSIVCVKRRRVGASWKEASDVLHDTIFTPFFIAGMNSKSEKDSKDLFAKVKFMYTNLPAFLRPAQISSTAMSSKFGIKEKDEWGNWIVTGTQSSIIVKAPTVTAWEGSMLNKWICDEAGKINHLSSMLALTEPALYEETLRTGLIILFGTSGEVGKEGKALHEIYNKAKYYKMKTFFFSGWMGLYVDKFGNDKKEDCIRWNVYERDNRKHISSKSYSDFVQQYPLNIIEAFMMSEGTGIGDIIKINTQHKSLIDNPPIVKKGEFYFDKDEVVQFGPDLLGPWDIWEHPDKTLTNGYVAGCDPVDHDDEKDEWGLDRSGISCFIRKKPKGLTDSYSVAEYFGRPSKKQDAYEQIAMALLYYGKTKVLIERNRFRMISFFEERGLKYLLARAPQGIMRILGGKINTMGVTMTVGFKKYLKGLIEGEIDDLCPNIPSAEFLQECIYFGQRNTDRVYAYGLALALEKEDRSKSRKKETELATIPNFGFQKSNSGKIIRYIKK